MYVVLRVYKNILCRGLVKWYDRGLQNLWWEFDSLIPCSKNTVNSVFFFMPCCISCYMQRRDHNTSVLHILTDCKLDCSVMAADNLYIGYA